MDRAGLVGDDGPTHHGVVRHRLPALPAEHRADGAARRGDARAHAAHRAAHDDGPVALRYPRGEGVGVPLPGDAASAIEIGTRRDPARGRRGSRCSATAAGVGKALEAADLLAERRHRRRPSPTRASPSRSTRALMAQLAAEHELLVTVEEGVLPAASARPCWETLNDAGRPGAAHPARRPARPLRHARQAGAAARRGRLHRRARSPSASQAALGAGARDPAARPR